MYDRILVPTDDPNEMETVFEHAAEIARAHDATVHAISVVDRRAFLTLDDELVDDVEQQLQEQGDQAIDRAREWFDRVDVDAETASLSGDPADEILRYADETDVDMIVMGTRRRDSNQAMLGSVSQKVTTQSERPVLVVDIID